MDSRSQKQDLERHTVKSGNGGKGPGKIKML
jgi:hypothetical protein